VKISALRKNAKNGAKTNLLTDLLENIDNKEAEFSISARS